MTAKTHTTYSKTHTKIQTVHKRQTERTIFTERHDT